MFNQQSKTSNVVRTSLWNGIAKIVTILSKFLVRTIFIMVLSKEYLGLDGLFTNILGVMSLADLGIATAISVRFYEPIKNNDPYNVGRLLNFYGSVYKKIALIVGVVGLSLLPFISNLLAEGAKVPEDINIYYIYLLYLSSSVVSYLYVYRLALFSADQKNYILAKLDIVFNVLNTIVQVSILYFGRNFTLMLVWNTVSVISWNFAVSLWVKHLYPEVFSVKESLNSEEQRAIWKDTQACLLHKFGGIVLNSTDSIVLTKMVSLAATGMYANYAQITGGIYGLTCNLLGNFVSSIGIARLDKTKEEYYDIYLKISFINKFIAVIAVCGTFLLLNDFVRLWIGNDYILDEFTVALICFNFYCSICRITNISFTNACGLFIKDRYRPLLESFINLGASIIATKYMGIAGVFLGTGISFLVTVGWREPYILYKFEFQKKVECYFLYALKFMTIALVFCCFTTFFKNLMEIGAPSSWLEFMLELILIVLSVIALLVLCLGKTKEFAFFVAFFKQKVLKKKI